MTQYIKSVQQIAALSLTTAASTYTLPAAVVLANSIIIPQGARNTGGGSVWYIAAGRWSFLSTTQVECRRDAAATAQFNAYATVVEFNSDVISIQSGVITILAGNTSATASVTAVGATGFVMLQGIETTAGTGGYTDSLACSVEMTASNVVTARVGYALASDIKVGWMVVELSSNIVESAEAFSKTDTTTSVSYAVTLGTTVDITRSIVIPNGFTCNVANTAMDRLVHTMILTAGNTVTLTRITGQASPNRTIRGIVVQFKAAALNGAIQRGTITGNGSGTTINSTISAVTLNMSWVNYNWQSSGVTSAGAGQMGITLSSTTNVQAMTGITSSTGATVAYEVVQFDNTPVAGGGKPWHYYNRMRDAA